MAFNREHSTPFQDEPLRTASQTRFGYPPIEVFLNQHEREIVASKGGLKGIDRDDEVHLARVIKDLALRTNTALLSEGAK